MDNDKPSVQTGNTVNKSGITSNSGNEGATSSRGDNSDEATSKKETQVNVHDKLKETFVKHGISLESEESLLRLLKDKDFKNLVKAKLDDDDTESSDETADVRMTRSKVKKALQNSPFKASLHDRDLPKFTEIPLSDNDDDDEEYKPLESSFESDRNAATPHRNESAPGPPAADTSTDPLMESCELYIDDSTMAGTTYTDKDLICARTRSKHSLQATPLDVLEAAFQPPDATSDMYDTDVGDYDWQQWLTDLMKDGGNNTAGSTTEDDPILDPDFRFAPEQEVPDKEDLRDDVSVRVTKQELNSLLKDKSKMADDGLPLRLYSGEGTSSMDDSISIPVSTKTPRVPVPNKSKTAVVQEAVIPVPILYVTDVQRETLCQQMQQHVQLLAQANVLCRNQDHVAEYVGESSLLLSELRDIGHRQMQDLGISSSAAIPWNLQAALDLTKVHIPPSSANVRLIRMEKIKGHVSLPTAVGEVIAHSRIFMYRELLPHSAPSAADFVHKTVFRPAEDALVALGLAEMSGLSNNLELISQHMVPAKTEKQIQSRIRNVLYCRFQSDSVNPITKYNSCKMLPPAQDSIQHVTEKTAQRPFNMSGTLPNWLVALKPLYTPQKANPEEVVPGPEPKKPSVPSPVSNPLPVSKSIPGHVTSTPVHAIMVPVHSHPTVSRMTVNSVIQASSPLKIGDNSPGPSGLQRSTPTEVSPKQPPTTQTTVPSAVTTSTPTKLLPSPPTTSQEEIDVVSSGNIKKPGAEAAAESSEYFFPSSSSSDEENDEFETKKSDKRAEEDVPQGEDDGLSDTMSSPNHRDHKQDSTNVKKRPRVRFINPEKTTMSPPFGGYLQKAHPSLRGRKSKAKPREARALRNMAKTIKTLEEDTIVQLDPNRQEKEKLFAMGYHERVQKALSGNPATYKKFIETLVKYGDGTRPVTELYGELATLLSNWPELVQGFAPFLMPEQAYECGLQAEQGVYARARKFLRQLEIQFSNKPDHLEKILNVFHTVAGTAIYREEEMMKSILGLLKDYPYLQDEFLTFFDDQRPPNVLLEDDFEEVDFTEELIRDPTISEFEQVTLVPEDTSTEPAVPSELATRKAKKRPISPTLLDKEKPVSKVASFSEDKENVHPEVTSAEVDDEIAFNTDYDTEEELEAHEPSEEMAVDKVSDEPCSSSQPPDITVISEDAISASPFKRIAEEDECLLRPDTPTGIGSTDTQSISLSQRTVSLSPTKSPANLELFPATPTGKSPFSKSASSSTDDVHKSTEIQGTEERDSKKDQPTVTETSDEGSAQKATTPLLPSAQSDREVANVATAATITESLPAAMEIDQHMHNTTKEDRDLPSGNGNIVSTNAPQSMTWTREIDTHILTSCQARGATSLVFAEIAQRFGCQASDIEHRLCRLLSLMTEGETDTETTSQESEEESETLESDT